MTDSIHPDPPQKHPSAAIELHRSDLSAADRRLAEMEMERVLGTTPFRMASDSSGAGIAHWKHDPLRDVVEPMTHHVIMAYNGLVQRMERRTGKAVTRRTFRPGVLVIIPEGSSSRWDIPKPVDVVQLYLPHATLQRVADEAHIDTPITFVERMGYPDPVISQLL
jgi:AraC family transcriptional regulator